MAAPFSQGNSSSRAARVFIAHAATDKPLVRDLYRRLQADGVAPWLDEMDILPGQSWRHEIERTIRGSDAVIVCLSSQSVSKAGWVQQEIKLALDAADERPEGTLFVIPVRLEECEVPDRLSRFHWVDLFEEGGYQRLLRSLRRRDSEVEISRTVQVARRAKNTRSLATLSTTLEELPQGDDGYLAQTGELRKRVDKIVDLNTYLQTLDRPIYREQASRNLLQAIEIFRLTVSDFDEPLASEFGVAAQSWENLARRELRKAEKIVAKQPVEQLFRAGDPVDRDREAFVRRDSIIGRLEQQVMLSTGCPGVILYGRRRRGKSTVLRNLSGSGFLPSSVLCATFSMQEPKAFSSLDGFLERLTSAISDQAKLVVGRKVDDPSVASYFRGVTDVRNLTDLYRFLSGWDEQLRQNDARLIVALDEYETIDLKVGQAVFPVDLMAAIRESIQTHRNITWVFAGSHQPDELDHVDWTSYLVSARTVDVPCFTINETRLLLTDPLQYSSLWKQNREGRPRFPNEFWGEDGIEAVHRESGGWPHLVQLLAETCIDLVNDSASRTVSEKLFDRAVDESVSRGRTVLSQLMRGESKLDGEWSYLSGFRDRESQDSTASEEIARSLRNREIVVQGPQGWRLKVPLMRRWLIRHG